MSTDLDTFCERQLTRLREAGIWAIFEAGAPQLLPQMTRVVTASDFVCESLARDPGLAKWLIDEGHLARTLQAEELAQRLASALSAAHDLTTFMAALRRQRQREMVRIAWRDLAADAPVPDILAETSAFADAAIAAAVDFAARELGPTYGTPRSAAGEPQPLIVLGMGKLGGGELNFSSDIDLVGSL